MERIDNKVEHCWEPGRKAGGYRGNWELLACEKSNEDMKRILSLVFRVVVIIFAAVGIVAICYGIYWFRERPQVIAAPNSFFIIDVLGSGSCNGHATRYYLDAPSSAKDIHTEGEELHYSLSMRTHFQSAAPLPGAIVSGSGKITFGTSVLTIENGLVKTDGHTVCSSELTLTRKGIYRDGPIRISR